MADNNSTSALYVIKLVIIGEFSVGKTSLVKKYISGQFSNDYRASIGTNLYITKLTYDENTEVKIQLWDIAGQEKWIKSRALYYSGTKAALIVADLTRKDTLDQIEKFWYPDFRANCQLPPVILIANKNDLKSEISEEEVEALGKKINAISILYTSAKTGDNVKKAFNLIAERAIKFHKD